MSPKISSSCEPSRTRSSETEPSMPASTRTLWPAAIARSTPARPTDRSRWPEVVLGHEDRRCAGPVLFQLRQPTIKVIDASLQLRKRPKHTHTFEMQRIGGHKLLSGDPKPHSNPQRRGQALQDGQPAPYLPTPVDEAQREVLLLRLTQR